MFQGHLKIRYVFFTIVFVVVSCLSGLTAQNTDENYIKATKYKIETTQSLPNPKVDEAFEQITYYDGLGNPKQVILYRQSGSGNDLITPIHYDGLGRQSKEYLPFTDGTQSLDLRIDPLTDLLNFYSQGDPQDTGNPHFDTTTNPYSETVFEFSPLSRPKKMAAPGDTWANSGTNNDKTIKIEYATNSTGEVRRYKANADGTNYNNLGKFEISLDQNQGHYPANELYVTITKDENWTSGNQHTTKEYKDKEGKVILKRVYGESLSRGENPTTVTVHDTYYVYDQFNNLTYVIPPLVDTSQTISSDALNGLCYQYVYDHRNRLVEKRLPDKDWEYIVYDKLDRPVATGPTHSPFIEDNTKGWLITKYDRLNRPIITGWSVQSGGFSSAVRKSLQETYNNQTVVSEKKSTSNNTLSGVTYRYTNNSYPTSGYSILTITYYDDYDFPEAPSSFPQQIGDGNDPIEVHYDNSNKKPKGLTTGVWERVTSESTVVVREMTYMFYDVKSNPVRTFTTNHTNGRTQTDSKVDFAGKVNYTITNHKKFSSDQDLEIKETFTYSNQDRLLKHNHIIGQSPVQQLSKNTYDELGQLIKKEVGSDTQTPNPDPIPLQAVDYRYNVRGWLTHINDIGNLQQGTDPRDLFAFKINYTGTQQGYNGAVTGLYNGNIAETLWRSDSDNVLRSYGYSYDPMNRLTNAIYGKPDAGIPITNNYNEWLSYDANGNILTLGRNGISDEHNNLIQIDNLAYEYKSDHSNILLTVDDGSQNTAGYAKGGHTQETDFGYDSYGNLVADHNKDISSITYNHLNLPVKIVFGGSSNKFIEYLYTATGQKVQKKVKHLDSLSTTRYIHGFQYYDNVLQFFHTPEGYVKNTPIQVGFFSFDYVYNYTDHLANIRVSYTQDPRDGNLTILNENHYYPFGLQHKNYNSGQWDIKLLEEENNEKGIDDDVEPGPLAVKNRGYQYKYNGKELQTEFGIEMYDFGARNYDPALGRWMNVDPLAEKMRRHSPYNYAFNNPIYFIDPDGKEAVAANDEEHRKKSLQDRVNAIAQMTRVQTSGNGVVEMNSFKDDTKSSSEGSDESESEEEGDCKTPPCIKVNGVWVPLEGTEMTMASDSAQRDNIELVTSFAPTPILSFNLFNWGKRFFVFKRAKSAYETALAGEKHSGFLKNYVGRSVDEINKAIKSMQSGKQGISVHLDKLENPSKWVPNWNTLRPEHRQSLIKGWQNTITKHTEQIEILKGILSNR